MKFLVLFLILFTQQITATVYSQDMKVTLHLEKASFQEMVQALEKATGYTFLYREDQVRDLGVVNIQGKDLVLEEVLNRCLENSGLGYRLVDQTIVIVPKREAVPAPQVSSMKISGVVTDQGGHPIPGATVVLKGTSVGMATDANGKFELTIPRTDRPVLLFSFIGMLSKEVVVTSDEPLRVILEEEVSEMSEVVVTGIFNRVRESYTGSVSEIKSEQLKMFRGQNLIATLANIDPSINMVTNNELGSDPNRLPEISIRGNSSLPQSLEELNEGVSAQLNMPLLIMDGFEISLSKLMDFNDEEIDNIVILKDASATAIYGSRGANGVIVINTIRPAQGNLRMSLQVGVNIEAPDLSSYNLMNAREKLRLELAAGLYDVKGDPAADLKQKQAYYEKLAEVEKGVNTYWLSQPVRTGVGQRYNLRLDFGTEQFQVGASLSYNNVMGVMKGSERNTFGGSLTLSYRHRNLLFRNQFSIDMNTSKNSKYGSFSSYASMNPYWRIYDEEGMLIRRYNNFKSTVSNPLYNAGLNIVDESKYTSLINNFSIEWNIVAGLALRANLGLSKRTSSSDYFLPPSHTSFNNVRTEIESFMKGSYTYENGESTNISGNVTLNYSKTWDDRHQLYVGLDYSVHESKSFNYSIMAQGFTADHLDFLPNALTYADGTKPEGSESHERSVGFTGNANYTFDNRYFVDLSYRIDGSSLFGNDNRFAPFWSVGIGWNMHNEEFMQNQDIFNMLRVKGSMGVSGSQEFSSYQALMTYKYYLNKRYIIWNGAEMMGLGNNELKWQTTPQQNIGLEVGLLNNRLTVSTDVYWKKTQDLLSAMDISLSTGFSSFTANIGEVRNTGFESSVSGYLIRDTRRNMMWSMTGKIAYNKNKILKLSDAIKAQTATYLEQNTELNQLLFEGHSLNSIYVVPSKGIDPSTGSEIFLDKNGNLTTSWNANAKQLAGVSQPKYRGNLSTYFSYKGFSLNLSFAYHWGGQQYNSTLVNRVEVTTIQMQNNVDKRVYDDRWINVGDVRPFKGFASTSTRASSRFVMDDNVFQFQTANLTYRWQSDFVKSTLKFQSITLGANMSDIFYISTIKRERGTSYPFSRKMGFTLSAIF